MPTLVATRCLDDFGRIVLPLEVISNLELQKGDYLDILYEGDTILLKQNREHTHCSVCRKPDVPLTEIGKIRICEECEMKIKLL